MSGMHDRFNMECGSKYKEDHPTRYKVGEEVVFFIEGERKTGVIEVVDFLGGGRCSGECHSYDILSSENLPMLYKHVPEKDVSNHIPAA